MKDLPLSAQYLEIPRCALGHVAGRNVVSRQRLTSWSLVMRRLLLVITVSLLSAGGCKSAGRAGLKDTTASSTAPYSSAQSELDAPKWLKGDGRLIFQKEFSTTIGGVTVKSHYRAWAPPAKANVRYPIVVFFHGNLGSNYGPNFLDKAKIRSSSTLKADGGLGQRYPMLEQARFDAFQGEQLWNNVIIVSILSPSYADRLYKDKKVSTWGSASQKSEKSFLPLNKLKINGEFSNRLLNEIFLSDQATLAADKNRVFLVGQSGGSLFLGSHFLPKYGSQLRGGAVFLCGNEVPFLPSLAKALDPSVIERFNFHLQTTKNESSTLKPVILEGLNFYGNKWADGNWKTITSDELYGKPELRYGAQVVHPTFGTTLSYAVDGDGKHCNFATKSQPSIIAQKIRDWTK